MHFHQAGSNEMMAPSKPRWVRWLAFLALALLIAYIAAQPDKPSLAFSVMSRIEALGAWGPIVFIMTYVAATVACLPGSLLTLAAGVVYGVAGGTVLVSVSSTLGAVAAFLSGRFLARDWVMGKIACDPRFMTLDEAIAREGGKIVLLVRLSPLFPFNIVNYVFGATRITLRQYTMASWLGMIPGTILYTWLGSMAGDIARAGQNARPQTAWEWAFHAFGLLCALIATCWIARIATTALKARILRNDAHPTNGISRQ
jgi:uncharacterized membrane protein YdjX (TVP38/TMEM64 family)